MQLEKQQRESYQRTMESMRDELKPSERLLSQVVHNTVLSLIERLISTVVIRPRSIMFGSILAATGLISMFILEIAYGYTSYYILVIIGFVVGWLSGIIYDILKRLFRHFRL